MEPHMHQKSSFVPVNMPEQEEMESDEEMDLLCKRKRCNVLGPIGQPLGEIAGPSTEKGIKEPVALPIGVSIGKKHKDGVTDQVGGTGGADGCRKENVQGSVGNENARIRLHKICCANHWEQPSFELCLEQGPPHNKLFTYKITFQVDNISKTRVECFSEPKYQKKAAQENAAEAALWYLKHFGHVH